MAKARIPISVMGVDRFFTPHFHTYHTYPYRMSPRICDGVVMKRREIAVFLRAATLARPLQPTKTKVDASQRHQPSQQL